MNEPIFSMPPAVSELNSTLSIGEFPRLDPVTADVVVNCTPEQHSRGRINIQFPFEDDIYVPNKALLHGLATAINDFRDAGLHVLVHCHAGLNRSGLVCALVLMQRGLSADEAIKHLRAKRDPLVLCNGQFERYLRSL